MFTRTTPPLPSSIIEFTQDLSHLRVPVNSSHETGPYEIPELVADRGFRASHIALILAHREGLKVPEKACTQTLFRDLPQVISKGNKEGINLSDRAVLDPLLDSFIEKLGKLGELIIRHWREGAFLESPLSVVVEDAEYLAEAFSLFEQRARGNLSVGQRLNDLSNLLSTAAAKDLFHEATATPPFRYWREFSDKDPLIKSVADYIFEIGKLRLESRSGMYYLGIRHESVAAHTFRAAQLGVIMAYLAKSYDPTGIAIDPHRVAAAVTVHENGETRVQDVNLVAKSYVDYKERLVIEHQTANLGEVGRLISEMWEDVEHRHTPAGIIAKDADRLEMVIEAGHLYRNGIPAADSLIHNTKPMFESAVAIRLFEEVEKQL